MKAQAQHKPIGQLKTVVGGGPQLMYGRKPIYGKRQQYLPAVKQVMFQVQVVFLGSLMWINVDPKDVS